MQLRDQQRVHHTINYVLENITASLTIAEVANTEKRSALRFFTMAPSQSSRAKRLRQK
ncbi:hypothetical protein [Psychromonas hadalis]|uniref:hypothetical protein n=1 Tax=Psychromonas hadalis TaxID=211669 RepID=UPI0012EB8E54|nr:hypothetical protein [Psychromonas hadalis]